MNKARGRHDDRLVSLILDACGNGGGHIPASEFTMQTLTPRPITPEPVQFICTPLNLAVVRQHRDNPSGIDLGAWFRSMEQTVETGSVFSSAFPITPVYGANRRASATPARWCA